MCLNRSVYSVNNPSLGNICFYPRLKIIFLFFLLLISFNNGLAQWVNNPSENTKLVIDGADPIDISAVEDSRGGAFIFWQDNKNGFQNETFFTHVDNNGKVTLRADGKKVTSLSGPEEGPVSAPNLPGSAIVVWKDITLSKSGSLYAQRVTSNGSYVWGSEGIEITKGDNDVSNYSVCADKNGDAFVSYVSKEPDVAGGYKLEVQKINPNGQLLIHGDSTVISSSFDRKNFTSIIPDEEGGAYVLWLEYHNNKSMLLAQRIDSSGKSIWGKKPVEVSSSLHNVILYTVKRLNFPAIYVAWQTQKSDKDIYHQIINEHGKNLWTAGGRLATPQKGNQINPGATIADSSIILCWTDDNGKNKDVYLQKFNRHGKALWGRSALPVIKYKGEQFGQKIIPDGKGGAIVSWVDMRNDSTFADIYAQKIDANGKAIWDSLGLKVGSNYNTLKSYLSLVTDDNGGAIAIFKNKRNSKNNIYGQRIFNSGTYVSQIVGFNTQISNDSIRVSWYSANERGKMKYTIERTAQADVDSINWDDVGSLYSDGLAGAKHYVYGDLPSVTGTLYYRVVQSDEEGNIQTSDVSRINYFGAASNVVVAQNIPNPFSDSTVISFYLPDPAEVTVEFYDSHVEKISDMDKNFPAGENKITFKAEGLKPGIYFYRFKVDDFVDVKKMVITN